MFPQTRASQTEINGITTSNGAVYTINGTDVTSKVGANNIEYCQYNNQWYKVEPVRYVLAGNSFTSGYGTDSGQITAVTENVVFASIWSQNKINLGGGYADSNILNCVEDFINDSNLNKGLLPITTQRENKLKNFAKITNGILVENNTTHSSNYILSSKEEIKEVFNDNYQAEFSDLVTDIIGQQNLMYWTRDVGSNLNNAECFTRFGSPMQNRMQKVLGGRITIVVSDIGCE